MLHRLLPLLFFALLFVACDDDNFDFDNFRETIPPTEPVVVEVSEPFFRYESPSGEIVETTSFGVNTFVGEETVSTAPISCGGLGYSYIDGQPDSGMSLVFLNSSFAIGRFYRTENGITTRIQTIYDPILGTCGTPPPNIEIYHQTDSTIYAHWEGELYTISDPNNPCDNFTSKGLFKADFFAFLEPCN